MPSPSVGVATDSSEETASGIEGVEDFAVLLHEAADLVAQGLAVFILGVFETHS